MQFALYCRWKNIYLRPAPYWISRHNQLILVCGPGGTNAVSPKEETSTGSWSELTSSLFCPYKKKHLRSAHSKVKQQNKACSYLRNQFKISSNVFSYGLMTSYRPYRPRWKKAQFFSIVWTLILYEYLGPSRALRHTINFVLGFCLLAFSP